MNTGFLGPAVATVLTVYGIETSECITIVDENSTIVATVLTVYGIETKYRFPLFLIFYKLQQYLPFTVLKLFVE